MPLPTAAAATPPAPITAAQTSEVPAPAAADIYRPATSQYYQAPPIANNSMPSSQGSPYNVNPLPVFSRVPYSSPNAPMYRPDNMGVLPNPNMPMNLPMPQFPPLSQMPPIIPNMAPMMNQYIPQQAIPNMFPTMAGAMPPTTAGIPVTQTIIPAMVPLSNLPAMNPNHPKESFINLES